MLKHFKTIAAAALIAVAVSAVLSCAGKNEGAVTASNGQKRMKIWFDTGGSPGESYGSVLQNGAAQAAEDLNIDIRFVYSDWSAEKMLQNRTEWL